ncbi:DUF4269 domain-containing protein [Thalassospira sp. ER-Se-21-Dark]|nr:DUF4269 domain-containing protein [Thalassospira sp. ER-Se-21-Dark]
MISNMNQTVMDWPEGLDGNGFSGGGRLANASPRGAQAAEILDRHRLIDCLAAYQPEVVGTLPLAIDVPESDIDILCNVPDLTVFSEFSGRAFGHFDGYRLHKRPATSHVAAALVVRFECDGLPIEIFATDCPTRLQYGFVHMLVEARILCVMGDEFAHQVRALKQAGTKTEPAFARLLGLSGDPYIELAELVSLSPPQLCQRLGVGGN